MTLTEQALEYARHHLQGVRVMWIDREPEEYDALDAVALCSDSGVSGRIMGVVAQDKTLERLLNQLIDGE